MAAQVAEIYAAKGSPLEIVDLHKLPPEIFAPDELRREAEPASRRFRKTLTKASAVIVVTPEYNGGFPGVFKYFIDMLKFPETFSRASRSPSSGLSAGGGGAVRPIEQFTTLVHLPARDQLSGERQHSAVNGHLDEKFRLKTPEFIERLEIQADGFIEFVKKVGK